MVEPVADGFGEVIEVEGQGFVGGARQDEEFVSVASELVKFLDLVEGGDGIGPAGDEEDVGEVMVDPAGGMEFGGVGAEEAGEFAQAGGDE